jgi:small GTP-binding protein
MRTESSYIRHRVVVIGNAHVGKTSILNKLVSDSFDDNENPTVGANFQVRVEEVKGLKIEIQIWDTAGQEKYRSLSPVYFRNSSAAIVVYDVSDRQSFIDLSQWITSFKGIAEPNSLIFVVGNKTDLSLQCVSVEEAKQWAEESGYLLFMTSAKTSEGIRELFKSVAENLVGIPQPTYRGKVDYTEPERPPSCFC